jgi:PPOX class probable F420-dependent enzyme
MLVAVRATTLKELPGWAIELLEESRVARLGFVDSEDRPRVLPVTYALHGGAIWSAVDQKPKRAGEPARIQYLRRRPEAALTVDRYSDAWEELRWIQALGDVEILAAGDAPGALEALIRKYEPYRSQPPPGPLIRLAPGRYLWWSAAG